MRPSPRLLFVAAALVAGGAVAFLTGGDEPADPAEAPLQALPGGRAAPTCVPVPDEVAEPEWFPADLPLPARSYPYEVIPPAHGIYRINYVLDVDLDTFVRFVLQEWPESGWTLGVGEREPGEAEDAFYKGERFGQFRARSDLCDRGRTRLLLALSTDESPPRVPMPSDAPSP